MKPKSVFLSTLLVFSFSAVIADPGVPEKGVEEEMVSGIVMDMDSKEPLRDVNITAILNSKREKIALTDMNGGYSFIMLKPGTYKLVFEKEGYKKVIKEKVLVTNQTSLQINIEMPEFVPFSERGPSAWHFFDY